MGEGFQYFDILLFAMVGAFLVLQLRRVLGRRTGTERPRDPLAGRLAAKRDANPVDNVVTLPDRAKPAEETGAPSTPQTVASGLDQIRNADPQFNVDVFLGGARAAFELIVHAFANGDTASLRPLLSDEVYEQFSDAIGH